MDCWEVMLRWLLTAPPPVAGQREAALASDGRSRLQHFLEHNVLRSEGLLSAGPHHEHGVDAGQRARPMGDHDDDAAARANAQDGARQRLVAFAVEAGVRLVEHHQEGLTIERPGKPDPLALAGRERRAALADLRLVSFGQTEDQLVDPGGLGRGNDRLRIRLGLKPRDILRHGTGEQFHVLRQVADMRAQCFRRPLIERRTVDADPCREQPARPRRWRAPGKICPTHSDQ